MLRHKRLVAASLFSLASVAQAHTHLQVSQPAEGAVVSGSPEYIALEFSSTARVTSLTLEREGGARQPLTPLPSAAIRSLKVAAPRLTPGKYTVTYRLLGADGHVMSGTLHFSVAGPAATGTAHQKL
jgi:methionine-rich copper-binding protein CopC